MGLVIVESLVTVDHLVREHLVTTVDGNPKISTIASGLKVTSIFTRLKASGKERRNRQRLGDNCHMLYALKQKDGLVTDLTSVRLLVENGHRILALIADRIKADTVVFMPSSYSLSKILGKRCAHAFHAQLIEGVFRKTTKLEAYEMLRRAESNGDISPPKKQQLDFRLKKSDGFSLKDIPTHHRHIFTPLHLNPGYAGAVRGRVVLVDDLLATGQTLSVAADLVGRMVGVTSVEAVCLFSDV